jgi:hypothetical protein
MGAVRATFQDNRDCGPTFKTAPSEGYVSLHGKEQGRTWRPFKATQRAAVQAIALLPRPPSATYSAAAERRSDPGTQAPGRVPHPVGPSAPSGPLVSAPAPSTTGRPGAGQTRGGARRKAGGGRRGGGAGGVEADVGQAKLADLDSDGKGGE